MLLELAHFFRKQERDKDISYPEKDGIICSTVDFFFNGLLDMYSNYYCLWGNIFLEM